MKKHKSLKAERKLKSKRNDESSIFGSLFEENYDRKLELPSFSKGKNELEKIHSSNDKLRKKIEKRDKKLKKKVERQKIVEAPHEVSSDNSSFFDSASDFFSDCEDKKISIDEHKSNFAKLQRVKRFVKSWSSDETEDSVSKHCVMHEKSKDISHDAKLQKSKIKHKKRSKSHKSSRRRSRDDKRESAYCELSDDPDVISKSSASYFYGHGQAVEKETSLELRVRENKESSLKLKLMNTYGSEKEQPTLKHERKRKSSECVSNHKHKRKLKESFSCEEDQVLHKRELKKKSKSREEPKRKKKKRKDSCDSSAAAFKSTKIKLNVSNNVDRIKSTIEKENGIDDSSANAFVQPDEDGVKASVDEVKMKQEDVKTENLAMGLSSETTETQETNVTESVNERSNQDDYDITAEVKNEANESLSADNDVKNPNEAMRERLKTLLEKKDFTPVAPEAPLRNLKIEVKPEKSSVLSSVPADSLKKRKSVSMSLKPNKAPKIDIKKNLALSKFLVQSEKEGRIAVFTPKTVLQIKPESDSESSDSNCSDSESVVYQGCANRPHPPSSASAGFGVSAVLKTLQAVSPQVKEELSELKKEEVKEEPSIEGDSISTELENSSGVGEANRVNGSREEFSSRSVRPEVAIKSQCKNEISQDETTEFASKCEPIGVDDNDTLNEGDQKSEFEDERRSDEEDENEINWFCSQAKDFLKASISEDVVLELDQLYADGLLTDPIGEDVIKNLADIGEELGLFIVQQFRESDMSKVRNRTLFFKGKVKLAVMKGKTLLAGAVIKKPQSAEEIAREKLALKKEQEMKEEELNIEESNIENVESSVSDIVSPEEETEVKSEINEVETKPESNTRNFAIPFEDFSSDKSTTEASFATSEPIKMKDEKVISIIDMSAFVSTAEPRKDEGEQFDYADDFFERPNRSVDVPTTKTESAAPKPASNPPFMAKSDASLSKSTPFPKSTPIPSIPPPSKPSGAIKIRSKREMSSKRAGRQQSLNCNNESASSFNSEVATLNQIIICGAGPSNYVPHQEGQYTPTKMQPNYAKLAELIQVTRYNYDESNPCIRCFGPPNDYHMKNPGQDCKLFVGKLPCDVFEDDLIPVFFEAGNIFELRVLLDPNTGLNKGFCFVTMCTRIETERALRLLHGRFIRPRHKMIVKREVPFNQLFFCNIPKEKSETEILSAFSECYTGITDCDLVYKSNSNGANSGFCILSFDSFHNAKICRQIAQTQPKQIPSWGGYKSYCADWVLPDDILHDKKPEGSSTVLVKNLKLNTTEDELKEHFSNYGSIQKVVVRNHVAFIVYQSSKDALNALRSSIVDGIPVEIVDNDPGSFSFYCDYLALSNRKICFFLRLTFF